MPVPLTWILPRLFPARLPICISGSRSDSLSTSGFCWASSGRRTPRCTMEPSSFGQQLWVHSRLARHFVSWCCAELLAGCLQCDLERGRCKGAGIRGVERQKYSPRQVKWKKRVCRPQGLYGLFGVRPTSAGDTI